VLRRELLRRHEVPQGIGMLIGDRWRRAGGGAGRNWLPGGGGGRERERESARGRAGVRGERVG
jgi:hypothetical protein